MEIQQWLQNRGIFCSNMELINQAFVHSSYVNEHRWEKHDNERLEFMGDAVLQVWVSERMMRLDQPLSEGKMTTLRAQLVCEQSLAEYTRKLNLAQFLKLGMGEEKTGGRDRDSILADMFEALLGALYLEAGMEPINNILTEVIMPHLQHPLDEIITDYKTKLQEYVQADLRKSVTYHVVSVTGPSNYPEFVIQVMLDDIVLGTGKGHSKKKAEQKAAQDAFSKMVK